MTFHILTIIKHVGILFEMQNKYRNIDSKVLKTKSGRIVLLNIFIITICNSRKSRFMKEQEAHGILSSLDLKTPLITIPLFYEFLFTLLNVMI